MNCIDKRIFLCYNRRVETKMFVFRFADIAQLAEHVIGNDEVGSSNLLNSSMKSALSWKERIFLYRPKQPSARPIVSDRPGGGLFFYFVLHRSFFNRPRPFTYFLAASIDSREEGRAGAFARSCFALCAADEFGCKAPTNARLSKRQKIKRKGSQKVRFLRAFPYIIL